MNIVRRLAAAIALLGILVGAPVLLWFIGRPLLPDALPSLAQAWASLKGRDTGALFLGALVVVGCATWLVFAVSVVAEIVSTLARRPSFNLPGLRVPQAFAAGLIMLILAGTLSVNAGQGGSGSASNLPPLPPPPVSQAAAFHSFSGGGHALGAGPGQAAGPVVDHYAPMPAGEPLPPAPSVPSTEMKKHAATSQETIWVVHKGDTLWPISERALGDPLRYGEIAESNIGRVQSDGRIFSSGDWLEIGWQVLLPAEAVVPADRLPVPEAARAETSVVVQRGDTLWQIAQDQLGDPLRYPELAAANNIADPNLIFIGQTVVIPASPGTPSSPRPGPTRTHGAPRVVPGAAPRVLGQPPLTAETAADPMSGGDLDSRPPRQAPPQAQPPATAGAANSQSAEVADTVDDGSALMTFAGLSAVAAAALWAALALAGRRRLPGRGDESADVARAVEAAGGPQLDIAWLDLALRHVAAELAEQDRRWPDVLGAELSSAGLTLRLAEPSAPPTPFAARGATWFLATGTALDPAVLRIRNWPAPLPALVSIGSDHAVSVMIDLERLGALQIAGDRRSRADMLNHLTVELACSGWCDGAAVLLVGWGRELVRLSPGRLTYRTDVTSVVRDLRVRLVETGSTLTAMGVDVLDGRIREPSNALWAPQIVLVDSDAFDPAELTDLQILMNELAQSGRTTTAIVLSGGVDTGNAAGAVGRVYLGPANSATVHGVSGVSDGSTLSAVGITEHEVAGLLAVGDLPAERAGWLQTRTRENVAIGTPASASADEAQDAGMYWMAPAGGQ